MKSYDNIKLEKGLYTTGKSFTQALEQEDPSENYIGTQLEGLDAYERQLKRFGIRVNGANSDSIEKFFKTSDSAALFPEYISRAVNLGIEEFNDVSKIVATTTLIDGMDYRTIASIPTDDEKELAVVNEGAFIPETKVRTQENLVKLHKRGRMLTASYEAIRFQRLDLFTVTLKQIGAHIARSQLSDAINVLVNGDGNNNPCQKYSLEGDSITYADLINFWGKFQPYTLNTIIASPKALTQILKLSEFRDAYTGLDFHSTGKLVTPFGAQLINCADVEDGAVIGLDKNFALEKVQAGEVMTEFDKLIDRQLERAAITTTAGFAKIFDKASAQLN